MAAVQVHHCQMLVYQDILPQRIRHLRLVCPAERSFHLDKHTQFIASFQQSLIGRIMRGTQIIDIPLAEKLHIPAPHIVIHRTAALGHDLMEAGTPQLDRVVIHKHLVSAYFNLPESHPAHAGLHHAVPIHQAASQAIQIRMLGVPFPGSRYREAHRQLFRLAGSQLAQLQPVVFQPYRAALRILQFKRQLILPRSRLSLMGDIHFGHQRSIRISGVERRAHMKQRQVGFGQGKQIQITRDTAQRMNGIPRRVRRRVGHRLRSNRHRHPVLGTTAHPVRHIQFESRKTAQMRARLLSVDIDPGITVNGIAAQLDPFPLPRGRNRKGPEIPGSLSLFHFKSLHHAFARYLYRLPELHRFLFPKLRFRSRVKPPLPGQRYSFLHHPFRQRREPGHFPGIQHSRQQQEK